MIKENSIDLAIVNCDKYKIDEELIKIMKPGAYLFGFDKSIKAYKSVCDIEDIGFIIKDSISYFYLEDNKAKEDTICLAMKPLSEKNFVDNIMKWGTGGLNIDGTRISTNEELRRSVGGFASKSDIFNNSERYKINTLNNKAPEGRYPANLIIHENITDVLDKQSGYSKSIRLENGANRKSQTEVVICPGGWKDYNRTKKTEGYNDEGGASRYFKNVNSYKELLKYIAVMGLPPKQGKVLFLGFDNTEEIISEINDEKETSYEFIGGIE